jgi:hypothetical protein
MKKFFFMIFLLLIVAGCSSNDAIEETPVPTPDNGENEPVVIDLDEGTVIVEPDYVEVQTDVGVAPVLGDWCPVGEVFSYEVEGSSGDSVILGMANYRGSEFCKAEAVTVTGSPVGDIETKTTYYFNNGASELWVIVETNSPMFPAPQINEMHIIDGALVN